jgi:hypothetical protein
MIPKGDFNTVSPRNAPPRDKITDVKIITGCSTELNRVTSIRKIKKIAIINAFNRNSSDSFWNSNSPVN